MSDKSIHGTLDRCIRLLRCYERSERDRGNTHQADAIQRHIDEVCAVGLELEGVREQPDGSFTTGGLFAYHYHELSDGTKQALRRRLKKETAQ
jgi:hypothetical protein